MPYDFSRLTERQQELLTFGGWRVGDDRPQPSPRTTSRLIRRGLVERHVIEDRSLRIVIYDVPLAVHIAWCEHCSRKYREVA